MLDQKLIVNSPTCPVMNEKESLTLMSEHYWPLWTVNGYQQPAINHDHQPALAIYKSIMYWPLFIIHQSNTFIVHHSAINMMIHHHHQYQWHLSTFIIVHHEWAMLIAIHQHIPTPTSRSNTYGWLSSRPNHQAFTILNDHRTLRCVCSESGLERIPAIHPPANQECHDLRSGVLWLVVTGDDSWLMNQLHKMVKSPLWWLLMMVIVDDGDKWWWW